MKGFNHLQLLSITNSIFNIPLNIFLFNNWKKLNACRFLNSYALKWYEVRCLNKLFRGSNFAQKFGAISLSTKNDATLQKKKTNYSAWPQIVTPQICTPQIVTPQIFTPQIVTPKIVTPKITCFSFFVLV